MATFVFKVGTPDGQIIEREVHAASAESAREELRRQGMHVFDARKRAFTWDFLKKAGRLVTTERFLLFNQELLALIRAGLPIIQSFDIMLERQKSHRFREVLAEIREKIRSGVALSDAFADYGRAFPPIYSNSLRAGERSGDMEGVIRRFLRYQKLMVTLRKRIVGALVYPAVLLVISTVMIFVMLTYVIPKFAEFYQGFGAELPVFTRVVIDFSQLVRQQFLLVAAIVALAIYLISRWSKSDRGGIILDQIKLRLPLIGGILHRFSMMQFSQALGTLLGGGTPMVPAIEIAAQSINNRLVSTKIGDIAQRVREGEPLWLSLEQTGVMSDLIIEMIKVGESTGSLVEMLTNVSEFYDEEIEAHLNRLIAAIEPIILVVLGVVIAGLLYAFYLPLFQLSRVAQ
ncbi:MAG: type II secretion system F family protein [Thermoanaerobaculia bacterium]